VKTCGAKSMDFGRGSAFSLVERILVFSQRIQIPRINVLENSPVNPTKPEPYLVPVPPLNDARLQPIPLWRGEESAIPIPLAGEPNTFLAEGETGARTIESEEIMRLWVRLRSALDRLRTTEAQPSAPGAPQRKP
jgi:hypothetical protein